MSVPSHNRKLTQYLKQDSACWLCSQPLDLFQPINAWGSASWEHVIPRSLGGSDHMANLVLTHWECNKARGDRFVFSLVRPTSHREMAELQSPKRGQYRFDYVWRKVNRAMKNISLMVSRTE